MNDKTKHTPGPWKAEVIHGKNGYGFQIQGAYTDTSAVIIADAPLFFTVIPKSCHATYDGQMANAALIAAAPDLLAALERIVDLAGWQDFWAGDRPEIKADLNGKYTVALDTARAAIAKAKGE